MPGVKGRSGRNRLPVAQLKANGTYRADRHKDRDREPQPQGRLMKPLGLEMIDPVADALWEQFITPMSETGALTSADAHAVMSLMWWHEKWRDLAELYENTMNMKVFEKMVKAWEKFESLALQLGYTPVARTRMKVPLSDEDDSATGIEKFMNGP